MKIRGVLVAGNWKMNRGPKETREFFASLIQSGVPKASGLRAWIFPPAISLTDAVDSAQDTSIEVGAQNVHWEKKGAFTGEVSGPMLSELGVQIALVGHSERRQYFGETDETAKKRTVSLLSQGFQVILCVGEIRAERESSQTQSVILRQLSAVLPSVTSYLDGRLIVAYEPVWAIGTGLTATPAQAEEAHQMIRAQVGEKTPILYGGSVTSENVASLLACPNVDGVLVGGASVQPESFLTLLQAGRKALS